MALLAFLSGRTAWAGSFRYRDFQLLWGATLFHSLAMGMEQVALGWLVLEMTDSPFMVGVSSALRMAPFFFLGLVSGAVADRVDRRVFLRVITLGGSMTSGLLALLLVLDIASTWHVLALATATGCLWAFTMTVRQAYIYDIVGPELALNGMSLNAVSQRLGGVLGAVAAGAIIQTAGIGGQYLAVSASYISAVMVLLATRDVGQAAPREHKPVVKNLVGYMGTIRHNRTLLALMFLTATTEIFGFTHQTLLPVIARDVLSVGALGLGFMTAVRQGGGMLGLMLLANMSNFRRKGTLMFATAAGFGLGQMAVPLASNIFLFLVLLTFINACASGVDTLYKTLMQASVPNEQRGRAMGSWVLSIGLAPVGHLSIGAIAGALSAPVALLINGSVLTFVTVASAMGMPRLRRLA